MDQERTDSELLARYASTRDQAAFALIVQRYAGLVYSAALRQVGAALAEDVSQAVFVILAQKAGTVDGRTLAGWLVNAARLTALASQRMELRRRTREQKAARMKQESSDHNPDGAPSWERLAPLLDEALGQLDEKARTAVTLRYFQGKSVSEVAQAMSLTESAAGKRATRAVQSLRDYFARRGVKLTAESLGTLLSANAIVAVPMSLTGKLAATATTSAALAGGTAAATGGAATAAAGQPLSAGAAGLVKGTLPLMATASSQSIAAAAVAAVLVVGVGGAVAYKVVAGQSAAPSRPAVASRGAPTTQPPLGLPSLSAASWMLSSPGPATSPGAASSIERFRTPPGEMASYTGRVEGLSPDGGDVGIVYLRGTQWTSFGNYQWQPVNTDGTFAIHAEKFPEARKALAVRAPGQSTTFLNAEFEADESARNIIVRMKPTRPIHITANDSHDQPVARFKAEIFDASATGRARLTDPDGKPLRTQRLDAPLTSTGEIVVDVPLEPLSVLVSGDGIAPYMTTIDPRQTDHFDFTLLKATPLSGTLLEDGKPVVGESLMLNNDAVAFSYTRRKTDANGHFTVPNGIPGTYHIEVRDRRLDVQLVEGVPAELKLELNELPLASAIARSLATAPATQSTSAPAH